VHIDWAGLGTVLWVGLVAGVGLVAVFAVGVRVLAGPAGRTTGNLAVATVCFTVCAVLAGVGIFLLLDK
jgi:hypothetical protein